MPRKLGHPTRANYDMIEIGTHYCSNRVENTMFTDDEKVYCPTCDKQFPARDLRSVYVHKCRTCGNELGFDEKIGSRNSNANFASDIAAIDDWLASAAQLNVLEIHRVRDREFVEEFLWDIRGLPIRPRCEILYAKRMPDVVTVQLCVDVANEEAMPKRSQHETVCALRGVQAAGVAGSRNWWGAKQLLSTAWLPPTLFRSVADRLAETIREIASQ